MTVGSYHWEFSMKLMSKSLVAVSFVAATSGGVDAIAQSSSVGASQAQATESQSTIKYRAELERAAVLFNMTYPTSVRPATDGRYIAGTVRDVQRFGAVLEFKMDFQPNTGQRFTTMPKVEVRDSRAIYWAMGGIDWLKLPADASGVAAVRSEYAMGQRKAQIEDADYAAAKTLEQRCLRNKGLWQEGAQYKTFERREGSRVGEIVGYEGRWVAGEVTTMYQNVCTYSIQFECRADALHQVGPRTLNWAPGQTTRTRSLSRCKTKNR